MENSHRKYLTFSFDDGTRQDRRLVALLNAYGLKATFNLNSGFFGQCHRIVHDGIDCDHSEIEASEVRELYRGHEVAVHTVHHPNLLELDKAGIIREVEDDRRALEALWEEPVVGMAYPGGPFYNDFVIETILKNTPIRYARTTRSHHTFALPRNLMQWHPTCKMEDEDVFALAEAFASARPQEDMLLYIWGHSFEFDKYRSWDRTERLLAMLAGKPDMEYATNKQIAAWIGRTWES